MSKIKMRCNTCGKWFQSANAKDVTCPDCAQKARREKMAAKNAPPSTNKPASSSGPGNYNRSVAPPPKPKPVQGGTSHWLDTLNDVKVGQPEQSVRPKLPPSPAPRETRGPGGAPGHSGYRDDRGFGGQRESRGPGAYREQEQRGPGAYREQERRGPGGYREQEPRGPGSYRPGGPAGNVTGVMGNRPRQPGEGPFSRGPRPERSGATSQTFTRPPGRPQGRPPRPASVPRPKQREKTPPPEPFTPTPEQITQVETRYVELATPSEFDGIRTQIAKELSIPKKAVKKIIKDLRDRQSIPSWWEMQIYKGSNEELDQIKTAYGPYLPVPPIGVHKQIADGLSLKPGVVYQAIKTIRLDLNLPQYNDPATHGEEFVLHYQKKAAPAPQASEETEKVPEGVASSGETSNDSAGQ